MYKDFDFDILEYTVMHDMNWWWMAFSLIFGITAQMFRGLRWKQTLEPLDEHPKTIDCIHAVFISYASSIIIPRIGEVTRCGVLKKYDGTSMAKSFGTVVTERMIDSLLVLLITVVVIVLEVQVFDMFFNETGTNIEDILRGFSTTGYIVTAICLLATITFAVVIFRKLKIHESMRQVFDNLKAGILSLKDVKNKWLFTFYTLMIWFSYFLHYYITFFCFDFTKDLGFSVAIISFIVGSISVIVPTPNGAGPWHFAVKTILVLFGLSATQGEAFVLIVHTIQTALIPILGIYSLIALQFKKPIQKQVENNKSTN